MSADERPVLTVRGLRVELDSGRPIVADLDLDLRSAQVLGIVGESGSGKTTAALALLGFAQRGARIAGGSVDVAGHRILELDDRARRRVRGSVVSYVPQDAGQALNPALRISDAVLDVIRQHRTGGTGDVLEVLAAVDLPATPAFAARLPHQLSGGQQQRVTIAMALSCDPPLVVMDEPTTGLDVITQASVLAEVRRLRDELGIAVVYVSHDLAAVAQLADRVAVMYAGQIVEQGPTEQILHRPRHPYTRGLVQSIPDHQEPRRLVPMAGTAVGVEDRPAGCCFAPRCPLADDRCAAEAPAPTGGPEESVRCFHADRTPPPAVGAHRVVRAVQATGPLLEVRGLRAGHRSGRDVVIAADDVSFALHPAECVALVGQSGSGKTTIASCIAGLHEPEDGVVALRGVPLAGRVRRRTVEQRRQLQYVFQNPFSSLNPRQTVREQLARPARTLRGLSGSAARAEVPGLLEMVRLPARTADRLPHQLSGGERQRVAIARALAARPDVLVCDEITSALDVSVQAAVLDVLAGLQQELSLALLFITHDLGVVSVAADRVVVLESGRVRETGGVAEVLHAPAHEYTRRLVDAAPRLPRASAPAEPLEATR